MELNKKSRKIERLLLYLVGSLIESSTCNQRVLGSDSGWVLPKK